MIRLPLGIIENFQIYQYHLKSQRTVYNIIYMNMDQVKSVMSTIARYGSGVESSNGIVISTTLMKI